MEPHVFETHYNGEHKLHLSAKSAVEEMAGWLNNENKEKLVSIVKGLSIGQSFSLGDLADGEVFRVGYGSNEMTQAYYFVVKE